MGKKRSPKGRTEVVFDAMRHHGFHPTDINFGNGYFIFDHGKDKVVHFHVKELKGWKFGIWWNIDGELQFDFFCQPERDIDKFKPAASTFVQEDVRYTDDDMIRWIEWDIIPMLKFIKRYPYISWSIGSRRWGNNIWDMAELSEFKCHLEYIKYSCKYYHYIPWLHRRLTKQYLGTVNAIADDCFVNPKIFDGNNGGWSCSPRFRLVCDGSKSEKLKPGNYYLDFAEELPDRLMKKVNRYNKKFNKLEKKYYGFGDIWLGEGIGVTVKKKGGKK